MYPKMLPIKPSGYKVENEIYLDFNGLKRGTMQERFQFKAKIS
jgi:hypothetical protein